MDSVRDNMIMDEVASDLDVFSAPMVHHILSALEGTGVVSIVRI